MDWQPIATAPKDDELVRDFEIDLWVSFTHTDEYKKGNGPCGMRICDAEWVDAEADRELLAEAGLPLKCGWTKTEDNKLLFIEDEYGGIVTHYLQVEGPEEMIAKDNVFQATLSGAPLRSHNGSRPEFFQCGHPRTPENTRKRELEDGTCKVECDICRKKRRRSYCKKNMDVGVDEVRQLADKHGIPFKTLYSRIKDYGWPIGRALSEENHSNNRPAIDIDGEAKTLAEWCRHFKIRNTIVTRRIKRGWPVKDALTTPVNSKGWHHRRQKPQLKYYFEAVERSKEDQIAEILLQSDITGRTREWLKLYADGLMQHEIANKYGVTKQAVSLEFVQLGLRTRRRRTSPHPKAQQVSG